MATAGHDQTHEGRDEDFPWEEKLNLKNLLNAPAIQKIVDWKEVGLELGIKEHELDRIDRDCRGRINDCVWEMLRYWLDNGPKLTWAEVSRAVTTVARRKQEAARMRQMSRESIEEKGSIAENAASQLQESLQELKMIDGEIADKQNELLRNWGEQKGRWESDEAEWRHKDREWEGGAESRQQKKKDLRAHNFQGSLFIEQCLRNTSLSNREEVCSMYMDVLREEVDRSRQLRSHHQKAEEHQRDMQGLLKENEAWKEFIIEHLEVYSKMKMSLEKFGLKPDKLERQLKELRNALEEYTAAIKDYNRAIVKGENDLTECKSQLAIFAKPFHDIAKQINQYYREERDRQITSWRRAGRNLGAAVAGEPGRYLGEAAGGFIGYFMPDPKREWSMGRTRRNMMETGERIKEEYKNLEKLGL